MALKGIIKDTIESLFKEREREKNKFDDSAPMSWNRIFCDEGNFR
jgi:hypothetical protein